MEEIKQPPIGLMPRWLWLEQRLDSINEAIDRYEKANYPVKDEWYNEKGAIIKELSNFYKTV